MTKNQFTGPSSIPAEVLDKIAAHRPHLQAIVANCQRQDVGRRFDKPLADAYLIGEVKLTGLETFFLSSCCAGRKYGESITGEMRYKPEATSNQADPSSVRDDIAPIFRADNTSGYSDQELLALNTEWAEIVEQEDLTPGTDEYEQRAKSFGDEVAGRIEGPVTQPVTIDHERYGDRTTFVSIEEAQAAIRACGPEFSTVELSTMPCGIVVDQTGDEVGFYHPPGCSCGSPECPECAAAQEVVHRKPRIEQHNLDGAGAKDCQVFDMEPATVMQSHWMGQGRPSELRPVPDYWAAVTDVPCPACADGGIRWAEAGYVPGYRICDGCGLHFMAQGTIEAPTLVCVPGRRG